jgi:hypothetical protein
MISRASLFTKEFDLTEALSVLTSQYVSEGIEPDFPVPVNNEVREEKEATPGPGRNTGAHGRRAKRRKLDPSKIGHEPRRKTEEKWMDRASPIQGDFNLRELPVGRGGYVGIPRLPPLSGASAQLELLLKRGMRYVAWDGQ